MPGPLLCSHGSVIGGSWVTSYQMKFQLSIAYNRAVPANLTAQYFEAESKFKQASTSAEKVQALEEMLRAIPKHKGTEKMQADIKKRLSKERKESQRKKSSGASQRPDHYVKREGAGQVVLCGPPNSGKSQLLTNLTEAQVEVADYPYTTRSPQPGMMPFEDILIQLVDTPPLSPESLEPWQLAMIQQSNLSLVIFDINDSELLEQTEFVLSKLEERGIIITPDQRPGLVFLGNKCDQPQGEANYSAWRELYEERFQAEPFSAISPTHLEALRHRLFKLLDIVRVYTKPPGKKPERNTDPFVFPRGSTILEVAATVHKDIAQSFKFARVWGHARFEGQMVERGYVLEDGDIVEIHA